MPSHRWFGLGSRHGFRAAILQHRHCPDDINDGIWYEDKIANAMVLSAHRLSPATIGRYLEAIEAYRPQVLIAYPSLAHLLATYAKEAGWRTKVFDLVLCGSETLYDFQRNHLESVLQAKVYIHYGHIESCALFGYCEVSNTYHVMLEYGHVEYLREDGSPADEGETCELVATSFDNLSVPLVRFQTRDWAQRGKGRCACGRANPLVERIEGREGDFVRTPSGKAHSPIVIEFLMDGRKGFADLQIVQDRLDEVMVKVVPAADFDTGELEYFCRLLTDELEHEVTVKSEIVEVIPRTWSQKKSLILSRLPDSGISRGTGAGEERRFGGSRRGPSADD